VAVGAVGGVLAFARNDDPALRASPPATTATPAAPSITVVQPDPGAAARIPVTGPTPEQLQTTREVLASLGSEPGVASVAFDGNGPKDVGHPSGQHQIVVVPTAADGVGRWLAQIATQAIVVRSNAGGDAITWYAFPDSGTTVEGLEATSAGAGAAAATAAGQVALDGATQAGFDAKVTVYPFGAVATEMRFRDEREYFAPRRTDWLHVAGGGGEDRSIQRFVGVDAPDGTQIFYLGYGVCYDCASAHDGPTPGTALPPSMAGPTRLVVDLSSSTGERSPVQVVIDCATAAALCDAVIRDRYALLQPLVSDTACGGGAGGLRVSIKGTLGGVAIDTAYGPCTGGAAQRWVDTLRAAGKLTGPWATDG
jgi:hypothetical protein